MQAIGHWFNFYVLLPIVSRLPTSLWAVSCRLASIPLGLLQWLRHGALQRRYLLAIGLPAGPMDLLRFSVDSAYLKLRHLEFYFYRSIPHAAEVWDSPPPVGPTMFVTLNTYGMESISLFLDRYPGLIVRRQWDGEPDADPSLVPPSGKWRVHQALVRGEHAGHREILVGASPMSYRKVRKVDRHLVIYQDVWDEQRPADASRQLFGKPTPLPLGGLRLAKMAGDLPLRMLFIEPRGGRWVFHASAPIHADPSALIQQIEGEIRRRPAAWILWTDWMDYQARMALKEPEKLIRHSGQLDGDEDSLPVTN